MRGDSCSPMFRSKTARKIDRCASSSMMRMLLLLLLMCFWHALTRKFGAA